VAGMLNMQHQQTPQQQQQLGNPQQYTPQTPQQSKQHVYLPPANVWDILLKLASLINDFVKHFHVFE
jgi:hypothetical protein